MNRVARLVGPGLFSKRSLQGAAVFALLLGLLVLAGGLSVGFVRMAWQEHQINRAIARQESQNIQQVNRNQVLEGLASFAESDVAAEQAARERLGMARPGETVLLPTVVLPPVPVQPPAPPAEAPPVALPVSVRFEPESNAARWVQAFFPGPDALP